MSYLYEPKEENKKNIMGTFEIRTRTGLLCLYYHTCSMPYCYPTVLPGHADLGCENTIQVDELKYGRIL